MFDKTEIEKWVQNGIDNNTVDKAFLWGWGFVCPNHIIKAITDKIILKKRDGTVLINEQYDKLTNRQRDDVVNDNKSDSLTTSQIRTVFGEMRRIQMNGYDSKKNDSTPEKTRFILLRPKLAYAVKRHGKKGLSNFYELFLIAHSAVIADNEMEETKRFTNFMNLMEAVLAYHKFHGGKE